MAFDEIVGKYSEPLPCDTCTLALDPIGKFSRARNCFCKVYKDLSNAKPTGVLFGNKPCKYYKNRPKSVNDGGEGSGNHHHDGRPGFVGGSAPKGGGTGGSGNKEKAKELEAKIEKMSRFGEAGKEREKLRKEAERLRGRENPADIPDEEIDKRMAEKDKELSDARERREKNLDMANEVGEKMYDLSEKMSEGPVTEEMRQEMKELEKESDRLTKEIVEAGKEIKSLVSYINKLESEKQRRRPGYGEWKIIQNSQSSGNVVFSRPPKDAKTLQNFSDYAEKRNRSILEKDGVTEEEIAEAEKALQKIFDEAEFGMFIPADALLGKGGALETHFKNQFETGSSRGILNGKVRREASNMLFGASKTLKPEEYEKYGVLVGNPRGAGCDVGYGYGNCVVTFKKEAMKGRTTYTMTDSLSVTHDDDATGMAAGSVSVGKVTLGGIAWSPDTELRNIRKVIQKPPRDYASLMSDLSTSYIELQYHGEVTVDDVATVCFKSQDDLFRYLEPEKEKFLKGKGIRVGYRKGEEFIEM